MTGETQKDEAISAEGISLVTVKSVSGNMKIISWDRPEVSVKVLKKSADGGEISEKPDEKDVEIKKEDSNLKIELKLIAIMPASDIKGYEIYVPESVDLDINSITGAIHVDGNKGKERISEDWRHRDR